MKRAGWGILAILFVLGSQFTPTYALDTVPSTGIQTKVNGPLLITGYSFTGHSLRYLQLYNSSSSVVSLNDWRVSLEYAPSGQQTYATLAGNVAPGKYVTIANETTVPTATFTFIDTNPTSDPIPTSVSLLAPASSNYLNEVATPSITSTTPRVTGTPATFYFARNISSSTGNFLSTFTAFIPSPTFGLISDGLYVAPVSPSLQTIEIYPDARTCSPIETDPACMDYVKLLNTSTAPIDLTQFRLRTGQYGSTSTNSNTAKLSGVLLPGHSESFSLNLSASGSWVWLEDAYGSMVYESSLQSYPSSSGHEQQAWSMDNQGVWQWTAFATPGDTPNVFAPAVPVNQCSGVIVNEIAANVATEDQYIELFNPSSVPIDLSGCIIQTNRSTTNQYVFSNEALEPGAFRTVYIKDTNLTLTKTTSGTVYILSSDGMSEVDSIYYENLAENTSWAMVQGQWVQTYAITPMAENMWLQYPACESGYNRNLETGLCNKITVAGSLTTTCGDGKQLNPDTNRCRSIVATTSLLTPCAPNQERNPETNRCRTITASANDLKPCAANQERNPDTNRCRNTNNSATTADFPVQAAAQSSQATLGWWAFGGVGTLAVGYAGWEWRREMFAIIKKTAGFISSRF